MFFSMKIILLLMLIQYAFFLPKAQMANTSISINQTSSAMLFGLNWMIWGCQATAPNTSIIKLHSNGISFQADTSVNLGISSITMQKKKLMKNALIYLKQASLRGIQVYSIDKPGLSKKLSYTSSNLIGDIAVSKIYGQIFYFSVGSVIRQGNITTNSSRILFEFNNSVILNVLTCGVDYLIVNWYPISYPTTGYYTVYNINTTQQISTIPLNYVNFTQCITTGYDEAGYFFRVCPFRIQVWAIPNDTLVMSLTMPYSSSNRFSNIVACNGFLAVLTQKQIVFYQKDTWYQCSTILLSQLVDPPISTTSQLKCINNSGLLGFQGFNSANFRTIYNISFSKDYSNCVENNAKNQIVQVDDSFINKANDSFINKAKQFINTKQFNKSSQIVSSSISIISSTPFLSPFLRPLAYIIMEVTQKADLLNQIKIKPSFFDEIIELFSSENQKYSNFNIIRERGPSQVYMLYSIQDVYTFNLLQGCSIVFFTFILRHVTRLLAHKHTIFNIMHQTFYVNSIWWNLLLVIIQNNIGTIVYFGAIQCNLFVTLEFKDKYNLIFMTIIFFVVFFYTYTFYRLMYRYKKPSESKNLLNVSKFSYYGFWLETCITCHRRFNVALLHGGLINNHLAQLVYLAILDISLIAIVVASRNIFCTKFTMLTSLIYFISFLALDCGLLVATQLLYKENLDQFRNNVGFNLYFIIIILILCSVSILKILHNIFIFMKKLRKKIKKKNEIYNMQKLKNRRDSKINEILKINSKKSLNIKIRTKAPAEDLQAIQNYPNIINKNVTMQIKKEPPTNTNQSVNKNTLALKMRKSRQQKLSLSQNLRLNQARRKDKQKIVKHRYFQQNPAVKESQLSNLQKSENFLWGKNRLFLNYLEPKK